MKFILATVSLSTACFPRVIFQCMIWGSEKKNVAFTIGHSIINRTSKTDVGKLMLEYDGGGHKRVGTCQIATPRAERIKQILIDRITGDG